MAPTSPYPNALTADERAALVAVIRLTGQARMLLQARIVLAVNDNAATANSCWSGCVTRTIRANRHASARCSGHRW